MSTQLQTRLLDEVSFPMTFEYLEQVAGVDVAGVLCDQLTQDYPTVSLELYSYERWRNSLLFRFSIGSHAEISCLDICDRTLELNFAENFILPVDPSLSSRKPEV